MKIIAVVSQKGGVGKSTLASDIAVQFAGEEWAVKIADMDVKQLSSCEWNAARMDAGIKPEVAAEAFNDVTKVQKIQGYDLVVVDGKGHSDADTLAIAKVSDLVIIPTKPSPFDLRPQVRLAHEFVKRGVDASRLIFVLNMVNDMASPLVKEARSYIEDAGYRVADRALLARNAYLISQAEGRSISETPFPTLATAAKELAEEIASELHKTETVR